MSKIITILLIDDADPSRQSVRRVLSKPTTIEYNVDCVGSDVEALTGIERNAHDVCIIDCADNSLHRLGTRLVADGEVPPHVDRVLSKPPKLRDLREALAQCLAVED